MTVDLSISQETDAFVLKTTKFYPTKIPLGHWQLRHLITYAEPDLIYYVQRHDIYCLNTTRNFRTHITVLPFSARCTASAHGWICVAGGDTNHIAIVRLDANEPRFPEFGSMPSRNPPGVKIEQLGSDIINSISIHKLQGNEERGIADDVVAVLTNNDKTVRIFSLTQHTQNTVLDLPFAVNHATISPDGRMLVAVGDYQQAYFYERVDMKPSPDYKSQKFASAHCMWELLNIVILHVPKPAVVAGYFTTAWSPSGRLCSVSSEMGYVTILDIDALRSIEDGEDAAVAVVPSTRPDTSIGPGGVRTTAFSPQPWDLFVWSEDQGRIVLADLRTGLCIRQVLHLDPEQEGLRHVEVEDHHPVNPLPYGLETEITRQFRRSHTSDEDYHASYLTSERRRIARAAMRLAEDEEHYPTLTSQERQLIDALGTRQREDSLSRSPAPRSIYYGGASSDFSSESRRSTAAQSSVFSQDFPGLARTSESGTNPNTAVPITISEYMRSRNNANSTGDRPSPYYSPQRQASILLASDDSDSVAAGSSSRTTSSRHPPLPPHLRPHSASFPEWARITDQSPPPDSGANPEIIERRRRAILRARERVLSLRETERGTLHQPSLTQRALSRGDIYDRGLGLRTAGLAISWDGRKIWAACDVGIFEYEINVKERMMRPAVEMK